MGRLRAGATNLALGVGVVAFSLLLVEGALRVFPRLLPLGYYGASRFDSELRMSVHGSRAIYNKVRFVVREPNAEGFMDVDHERTKSVGVVRVGFFGDSFVESVQVPFDQVFYRLLPHRIAGRPVEPFGFGISGWGTLHCLLAYEAKAAFYDLDVAIYVFVENDLGDNTILVKGARRGSSNSVFAELSPLAPGFEIVRRIPLEQQGVALRVAKGFQQESLLARLVWSRLALLIGHGTALRAEAAQREMATRADRIPSQNDLPSSWPAPYRRRAQELGRRILDAWRRQTLRDGRDLIVLYVPRGEEQLRGELPLADTWRPWLGSVTEELGIPLLDPSEALEARLALGDSVYEDHWTPAGHEVIAGLLDRFLASRLSEGAE